MNLKENSDGSTRKIRGKNLKKIPRIPEDPVFGTPDKVHFEFLIFMFIRGPMYMSVIFFLIFVPIKLTFIRYSWNFF